MLEHIDVPGYAIRPPSEKELNLLAKATCMVEICLEEDLDEEQIMDNLEIVHECLKELLFGETVDLYIDEEPQEKQNDE
jgi:hypothetical protein